MSKFNFSNVLGGAVFGSLNAFLQHNASRDGYSRPNRYEVITFTIWCYWCIISRCNGESAMSAMYTSNTYMVKLQEEYHFVVIRYQCQTEV